MTFFVKNALGFAKMASRIMPISINRDQQAGVVRRMLPAVLFSVIVTLAVIAGVTIFFWTDDIDFAGQQPTMAINDRSAAEKILAQTGGTKAINKSLAAEDQVIALSARLSTLQDAMTPILHDNAALAEQLRATQTRITQMAQDNAALAEQLRAAQTRITLMAQDKAVVAEQPTQMAFNNASAAEKLEESHEHMAGTLAKDSEESLRPQAPLPRPIPTPAIPQRRQIVMRNWF
jgi:hypothetical protein